MVKFFQNLKIHFFMKTLMTISIFSYFFIGSLFHDQLLIYHTQLEQRSSQDVLWKILKHLAVFTRKHLCWSLFLIKTRAHACNFIKNRLQHRLFPVNKATFLRTPILKNICERLLLRSAFILKECMSFQRFILFYY